jgi:predicted esterase
MRIESTPEQAEFVGLRYLYRASVDPSAPLFVLVHGRAGNVGVMWAFERCIPPSAAVISFEATLPDSVGGMSWWEMLPGESTPPEKITAAVSRVSYALSQFLLLEQLSPQRTAFLGFSQGAALISVGMLSGELRGVGFGLLCGLVPRFALSSVASVQNRTRVFIAHGTKDTIISVERAYEARDSLGALGLAVEYVEDEVEHRLGVIGTRALKAWCHSFESGL